MITLNCIYVTLYFYKNTFNVSTVRIKIARSTIGYSEVDLKFFTLDMKHFCIEPISKNIKITCLFLKCVGFEKFV